MKPSTIIQRNRNINTELIIRIKVLGEEVNLIVRALKVISITINMGIANGRIFFFFLNK
tara:strand:+ start:416 stop:592 length:177 start_codon:yes stop_codon:yes gene_type:complete